MFDVLVESGVQPGHAIGPRLFSVVVHGGLIALAAAGVRGVVPAQPDRPIAVPIDIYTAPATSSPPTSGGSVVLPGSIAAPPPLAPTDVPVSMPPVTPATGLPAAGLTPQQLAGRQLGQPTFGGEAPGLPAVLLAGEVDEPVKVLVPARPVYPPALAAAGVPGEVRVEFVVDTAGTCEPASVRVVSSTRPAFEAPALTAVCEARYRPGRVRGAPVRQLVQQRVVFRQP